MTDLGNQSRKKKKLPFEKVGARRGGGGLNPDRPPPVRSLMYTSPHVRESRKFLLVESKILAFGIGNTAQGIQNPTNHWKLQSKFHYKEWIPVTGIQNPRLTRIFQFHGANDIKFPQQSMPPCIRSPNFPHCIKVET